jgi:hypothetical protein
MANQVRLAELRAKLGRSDEDEANRVLQHVHPRGGRSQVVRQLVQAFTTDSAFMAFFQGSDYYRLRSALGEPIWKWREDHELGVDGEEFEELTDDVWPEIQKALKRNRPA